MAIRARGLRKAFGEHQVLDCIDIDVAPGAIFALLGPNGAGKTTTVQILATLKRADAGEIEVAGQRDPARIRELAAAGVTIFLTTQYLDEADELADRIAVLDKAKIVAEGTPAELKRRLPRGHVRPCWPGTSAAPS